MSQDSKASPSQPELAAEAEPQLVDPELGKQPAALGHDQQPLASLSVPSIPVLKENPRILQNDIAMQVRNTLIRDMQQCFEYRTQKDVPLAVGSYTDDHRSLIVVTTGVYDAKDNIYKRSRVSTIPFVRTTPSGEVYVTLRRFEDGEEDLLELFNKDFAAQKPGKVDPMEGFAYGGETIKVTKVAPTTSEKLLLQKQALEDQRRQQQEQEALALMEQVEREHQLQPAYVQRGPEDGKFFFLNKELLTKPLASSEQVESLSTKKAKIEAKFRSQTASTSEDGRNVDGVNAFRNDRVHQQLADLHNALTEFFTLRLLSAEARMNVETGKPYGIPLPPSRVVFLYTDVQHAFEYDYENVSKNGVVCDIFPCFVNTVNDTNCLQVASNQLLRDFQIQNPQYFSLNTRFVRVNGHFTMEDRIQLNCLESDPMTRVGLELALTKLRERLHQKFEVHRRAPLQAPPVPVVPTSFAILQKPAAPPSSSASLGAAAPVVAKSCASCPRPMSTPTAQPPSIGQLKREFASTYRYQPETIVESDTDNDNATDDDEADEEEEEEDDEDQSTATRGLLP